MDDLTDPKKNDLIPPDEEAPVDCSELAELERDEREGLPAELDPAQNELLPSAKTSLADALNEQLEAQLEGDTLELGGVRIEKMASGSFAVDVAGRLVPLREAPAKMLLKLWARLESE